MIDVEKIINSNESARKAIKNTVYFGLDEYMDMDSFKKQTIDIGFCCWIPYLTIDGKEMAVNFKNAMLSMDKSDPSLFITSEEFITVKSKNAKLSSFDNIGVRSIPSWIEILKKSTLNDRKNAKTIALNGVLKYNKGSVTSRGKSLVAELKSDCEFLGFVPHVSYIKDKAKVKSELKNIWIHPFAQRTLLYKLKDTPCLIMINSSIDLNDSALRKISGNKNLEKLKNIGGITG